MQLVFFFFGLHFLPAWPGCSGHDRTWAWSKGGRGASHQALYSKTALVNMHIETAYCKETWEDSATF